MSKIYELDRSLFDKVNMYPTYNKFIFTDKHKRNIVAVDNTSGDFFTEDFSNRIKGLIYLVNDSFLPDEVEKEYLEHKDKYSYEKYKNIVCDSIDYCLDNNIYDRDFLKFDPNKKYTFDINLGYGEQHFKSTIKDALGLAINYESDLGFNGTLLISPLGFEWEENNRFIEKCVGRENLSSPGNMFGWFLPYRNQQSKQIEWIKENTKDMKL